MDEVKINTSKTLTLTLPSDPTSNSVSVSLYHEFGDLVSGPTSATRTGTGVYTITYGQESSGIYILNSSGKYKAEFTYAVSGTTYTQTQIINVYTPYITYEEFFE
jgi:flagellar hook assembly protein FlgD